MTEAGNVTQQVWYEWRIVGLSSFLRANGTYTSMWTPGPRVPPDYGGHASSADYFIDEVLPSSRHRHFEQFVHGYRRVVILNIVEIPPVEVIDEEILHWSKIFANAERQVQLLDDLRARAKPSGT